MYKFHHPEVIITLHHFMFVINEVKYKKTKIHQFHIENDEDNKEKLYEGKHK